LVTVLPPTLLAVDVPLLLELVVLLVVVVLLELVVLLEVLLVRPEVVLVAGGPTGL
jgi:hypothetical protein